LLLRVRAAGPDLPGQPAVSHAPPPLRSSLKIFNWAAQTPGRFHAAQRLVGLLSRLAAPFSPWLPLPRRSGWGLSRDLARPALRPFHARWDSIRQDVVNPQEIGAHAGEAKEPNLAVLEVVRPETGRRPAERFADELSALGGEFRLCQGSELGGVLLNFLRKRAIDRIQAWEPDHLPAKVVEDLEAAGIEIQYSADPSIRVGLTGALAGAAETGTLVLPAGPGRSPLASLLPEIHLALLPYDAIRPSLVEVLNLEALKTASSVALISGPSRTADIEMTLTIGVHGPGEVHVFCYQ
jgi:L-lactate dehydrogenase complex protein LldG